MGNRPRFNILGQAHFVTFSTWQGKRIINGDKLFQIIIDNFNFYRSKFGFKLLAFAVLPWHVHLLIMLNERFNDISRVMRDFKKFTAVQIIRQLIEDKESDLLAQLSYSGQVEFYQPTLGRRCAPVGSENPTEPYGVSEDLNVTGALPEDPTEPYRVFEDPTVSDGLAVSKNRTHPTSKVSRSSDRRKELKYHVWQTDFYDFNVYSYKKFYQKVIYINYNAVKHGLVDDPYDWLYSSYINYEYGNESLIRIDRLDL